MDKAAELLQYAAKQLSASKEIYIASVDSEGYPRVCTVSPLKTEGVGIIWFLSSSASEKIRQFRANPKAGVCYGQGEERQLLSGRVAIIEDDLIKRRLWRDSLTDWFPGGADDPGICAVKFTAERATLWHRGFSMSLTGNEICR